MDHADATRAASGISLLIHDSVHPAAPRPTHPHSRPDRRCDGEKIARPLLAVEEWARCVGR